MKITDTVNDIVKDAVEQAGYELVEVEYQKEQGNWVLTLYIDSPNGITLDDCEKVSKIVDPILDEADPIEEAYYLSVSSLGIDRPIKKDRDFERNIGKEVDVKLYAPIEKKKEFRGKLISYNDNEFVISKGNSEKTMTILRKDAALIRPHIDFN